MIYVHYGDLRLNLLPTQQDGWIRSDVQNGIQLRNRLVDAIKSKSQCAKVLRFINFFN